MSASKRISKKQMKEDKLVSTMFRAWEYAQNNSKQFLIGGSVLAVIFLAVLFINWQGEKNLAEAQGLYTRAHLSMDMGLGDEAIADFKTIIEDFSSTQPAAQSCYLLANVLYEQGKYEEAITYFEIVLSKYSDDKVMAANAAGGLGSCLGVQGDYAQAADNYNKAVEYSDDPVFVPGFLLNAGDAYVLAGDTESAKACFKQIIDEYSQAPETALAKRSLAALEI